jgi:hypothetical protein
MQLAPAHGPDARRDLRVGLLKSNRQGRRDFSMWQGRTKSEVMVNLLSVTGITMITLDIASRPRK